MSTPPKAPLSEKEINRIIKRQQWERRRGMLFLFAILSGVSYWAYTSLDDAGWVPHTRTVDMYMKGDWLQGENRKCGGVGALEEEGMVLKGIFCPSDTSNDMPHNMSIQFWGRVSREDVSSIDEIKSTKFNWSCKRNSEGFVCKALD